GLASPPPARDGGPRRRRSRLRGDGPWAGRGGGGRRPCAPDGTPRHRGPPRWAERPSARCSANGRSRCAGDRATRYRAGGSRPRGAPAGTPEEKARSPMSFFVYIMMGIAVWHFAVWFPDRFWGGIVGAFIASIIGAIVIGFAIAGFQVVGRHDLYLGVAVEAI